MSLPFLKRLSASSGGSARPIALLPDALFFVRSVPIDPAVPELASQVELAIEALSPFPPAQLFYGYFTRPGATRALVYAAYRKRFTAEDAATWAGADVVVPSFVSVLGGEQEPATAVVLTGAEAITVVAYAEGGVVPTAVVCGPLPPESTEAQRQAVRDDLLKGLGGTRKIVESAPATGLDPGGAENEWVFVTGVGRVSFDRTADAAIDVRDKGELAALRRARQRDLYLWRGFAAAVALIALCGVAELAMMGGAVWQKGRLAVVARQQPVVEEIMTAQALATRIDELSTKRLRPFEMILAVSAKKPGSVIFSRTTTSGLTTLVVRGRSESQGDIDAFSQGVSALPECERSEAVIERTTNGVSTFVLTVVFKPDAFRAVAPVEGGSS